MNIMKRLTLKIIKSSGENDLKMKGAFSVINIRGLVKKAGEISRSLILTEDGKKNIWKRKSDIFGKDISAMK